MDFKYQCENQMDIFDLTLQRFKIDKPVRLIELFAGVGSQAMAIRDLGKDFEHYKIAEWEVNAFRSYKAIHFEDDVNDYSQNYDVQWLRNELLRLGISNNGKEPMSMKEIERKNEVWVRETYNNIKATHNLVSVTNFHGKDLEINETDKFVYIMCYSFPCQDLSVAGKMKGMKKGSGTRSGMLWEVERLLDEMNELPQVLLMENVPQVISSDNINDFHEWQDFLKSKGYTNYIQVLNSKDYGVPQNRERAFMVSILGEYNYKFPKAEPLEIRLKDVLEPVVDEKYYLQGVKVNQLIKYVTEKTEIKEISGCDGTINEPKIKDISNCIKARYDCGISNQKSDGTMVLIPQATKEGYIPCEIPGIADLSYPDRKTRRGRVQENGTICPTLTAAKQDLMYFEPMIAASRGRNPENPSDRTPGNPTEQRLEINKDGVSNTLTTVQKDNYVIEPSGIYTGVSERFQAGPLNGLSRCLKSEKHDASVIESDFRVRKLTPLECWRLMSFTDEDFDKAAKVNSDTQLYKQAGNSIVKSVLMGIFNQLY